MLRSESIPLVPFAKRCTKCRCQPSNPLRRRPVDDHFPRQRGSSNISLGRRIRGWEEGWEVYLVQGWCRWVQLGILRYFPRLRWVLQFIYLGRLFSVKDTNDNFHWTNYNCVWVLNLRNGPSENYQLGNRLLGRCWLGQGWRAPMWEAEKLPFFGKQTIWEEQCWWASGEKENNILMKNLGLWSDPIVIVLVWGKDVLRRRKHALQIYPHLGVHIMTEILKEN